MRHKLLARQLRATLGVASERALQDLFSALRARGDGAAADGLAALLSMVEHSYESYERDLQVRTRMLEISSEELLGANAQLRDEAERQRTVLRSLQTSVQRLTFDAGLPPAPAGDAEHDLLALTQALALLVQQRESARELTEQILDQLPIPVFLKDREGRFVRFNRQFQQFAQCSRDQMLGHKIEDFASGSWAAATHEEDQQAWRSGRLVSTERRLANINPPRDFLVNRIVINSGGESYLLGFSIDVSEQRAARDAMQRGVESAQAASRAKSEFLANMSHEIRTPLNGILGMTELMLESKLDTEQREDLALVKASADALLGIVNDILDFSKIEAGKLDIEEVPFDLARLVRETVRAMAWRARQKGLELRCDMPASLPRMVRGDPGRLRQVLVNLLGNAIKFTAYGKVELALRALREREDRCEVEFAVSDTGIGIAPDKQKLIFDAFSQVDGSTTRQYGGTGLGLAISRRLVFLMQGQLDVSSEPGVGSTFRFSIPLKPTALPLSWLAGTPVLPAASDGAALAAPASDADTIGAAAAGPGATGLRILLAEDNQVNQRLALRLLEKMGHRITLVDNGHAALEGGMHGGFDLILMDVQMPGLDGLSATRQIRQWEHQHGGHVPIIAMTARAMQGDRERCLEAGMDDYLSKPIDSERLRQLVGQFDTGQSDPLLSWGGALQRLDGDAALLLELAGIFIDDGPLLLQTLVDALQAGDLAASQRAVHSLKGVLVNFGATRAIALADRMSASLHDPSQAGQWLDLAQGMTPALQDVYQALRELIAAGPGAMS
jgi:PAS domain S-box-containing protein